MLMLLNIILLLLSVGADCVNLQSVGAPRCEKITTPLCQHLGYNTTVMPNFMGHEDQRDAAVGLHLYKDLLNHNCSAVLRLFVCSVFIPLCSEHVPAAVPACRGLCEEVKRDCVSSLQINIGWPAELDCNKFPEPPNLCIQKPSEEDLKDVSSEQLYNLRGSMTQLCPSNSVPGSNNKCLKKCNTDDSDKTIYNAWGMFWTLACLIVTTFALQTFLTQPKRFRWPARPILYLSFCGFVKAVVFLIRWIVGPFICVDSSILEKPTDSLGCTSVALLLVYIDVATCSWWTVFCFVWYLSASKEWSTEAIEKISTKLHAFVWTFSTIPLVFILISRNIRSNELSGFCEISGTFLTVSQLLTVTIGFSLGIFTSIALKNVRVTLIDDGLSPYKLERLILRLGIISLGIFVCLFFSLTSNFFENFYGGVQMVKKKIQSLRSISRKEFNKVERSMRSGRGSDDIYSPNLWYYDLLMFIKDQEQAVPSISNIRSPSVLSKDINNENNDFDDNDNNKERENDEEYSQDQEMQELGSIDESLDGGLDS
ncbi:hypothetical protein FQR65_LT01747 [Abscondita terminalis]|nr:hypothetical protein FQR65_LT01747 [Abscondita terminalis]